MGIAAAGGGSGADRAVRKEISEILRFLQIALVLRYRAIKIYALPFVPVGVCISGHLSPTFLRPPLIANINKRTLCFKARRCTRKNGVFSHFPHEAFLKRIPEFYNNFFPHYRFNGKLFSQPFDFGPARDRRDSSSWGVLGPGGSLQKTLRQALSQTR